MSATVPIEIRRLEAAEAHAQLDALAAVLTDCVAGGASVGYMAPFSHEHARDAFEECVAEVEQGRRLLLAAFADGELVGTAQVILALMPTSRTAGRSRSCSSTARHAGAASRSG